VLDIQSKVDGVIDLLEPSRVLIKEGNLLFSPQPEKIPIEHRVFLFNGNILINMKLNISDLILFAKRKDKILLTVTFSKEYQLKGEVYLENARVILCGDSSSMMHLFLLILCSP
jgi:hypothetical protein